ncbi:hypothetical protein Pla123a_05560 [Posidoniimonas polymericola]|uniref:Uncharacterized protein n=1 Tax=Posidoniimonas polymericola TaxID=2528002 RepID=A0A5C5ZE95_9BACT|nr:hypothetical protein [Posidoniimonas polymericola]TWT85749.1 hypothetical protein Pla123a_05560 [Posidoniimonas polymericola]
MDPVLIKMLGTIIGYSVCGSIVAFAIRWRNSDQPGPRPDQAAAVGALIGAGIGAVAAVFGSMLDRV